MLERGSLVIYDRDFRHPSAWTSYAVLGLAPQDDRGNLRLIIQSIQRGSVYSPGVTTFKPMRVLAAECVPIEAYGFRIASMKTRWGGHHCNCLELRRDPFLPITATRRWGGFPELSPSVNRFSSIDDDDLCDLIVDRWTAPERVAA